MQNICFQAFGANLRNVVPMKMYGIRKLDNHPLKILICHGGAYNGENPLGGCLGLGRRSNYLFRCPEWSVVFPSLLSCSAAGRRI